MLSRRDFMTSIAVTGAVMVASSALPAAARPHGQAQTELITLDFAELNPAGLPRYLVISNPTDMVLDAVNIRMNARQLDSAGLIGMASQAIPALEGDHGFKSEDGVWNFRLPEAISPQVTSIFELQWTGEPATGLRLLATAQLSTDHNDYYEVFSQEFVVGQPFSSSLQVVPSRPRRPERPEQPKQPKRPRRRRPKPRPRTQTPWWKTFPF
ncbi:twin-arginine translocation signal domain-containing protein [Corynebacterium sp. ES2794-CONJ1]|uniref:twin-arginine translocation signal domain-containing protein n=1 Tax=unclassified Corynebacterium TaxID=2624378 RepID=UPI0021699B72|nr:MULTISPECIES: twin-arginine translocation signal domain-containing protein [unclassified Corynebacterium]MCS4490261.1 twin-arginine translocation signal domain-containing protein [Corynebacterium sp. ES2775-CONJ]MCS4491928.1 twin-arginine translocation signal domain-containing protein [Corynebacterium sp. ES2715-CONJ3]MCS4532033.1 twin-arginine translocation signal domain-containing protein [Corynebacterium sp. ES2730-CONJ]MCU9519434.1 twin-arginine translocation signal domain-containing pro